MSTPRVQKSLRFKPEHAAALDEMAERDGKSFQAVIDTMVEDSFAIIKTELKKQRQESAEQAEALRTTLQAEFEAQKDELSSENERLTAQIDELTEIEAEQTKTIKDLTKAVETLSRQTEELTNAHDEKSRTLDDLTTKYVNLRLTPEQMEALKALIEYRAQFTRSQEHDEFAETPEEFVYVYLSNGIAGRNWKPDEYDYSELFPTLEAHLERLGLEKSNETPDDEASDEAPEGQDESDDAENDDENDFEDEGPADE